MTGEQFVVVFGGFQPQEFADHLLGAGRTGKRAAPPAGLADSLPGLTGEYGSWLLVIGNVELATSRGSRSMPDSLEVRGVERNRPGAGNTPPYALAKPSAW
ncbi:MAG TPA: hypothetical protein VFB83_10030 [Propionibacteriaceae bacterium]|nr:hypothetical protein [Propionibacteriaceae bacterium]